MLWAIYKSHIQCSYTARQSHSIFIVTLLIAIPNHGAQIAASTPQCKSFLRFLVTINELPAILITCYWVLHSIKPNLCKHHGGYCCCQGPSLYLLPMSNAFNAFLLEYTTPKPSDSSCYIEIQQSPEFCWCIMPHATSPVVLHRELLLKPGQRPQIQRMKTKFLLVSLSNHFCALHWFLCNKTELCRLWKATPACQLGCYLKRSPNLGATTEPKHPR